MRLTTNNLILWLLICCSYSCLLAQQYGYVQYNLEYGAPFKEVNSVIQNEDGFIWIGSENGLYRFDGITFDFFSIHTESQFIYKLQSYGDKVRLVNDKGVYEVESLKADTKLKPIIEGSINETDKLPFYPNNFLSSKEGTIWLSQSNHTIGKWENAQFETYRFSKIETEQKLLLSEDATGGIWVLSPIDGLFLFNKTTNIFEKKLDIKNGTVLLVANNQIIIGNESLHIYTLSNNQINLAKTFPIANDRISAINKDKNNNYFVGTVNGKLFKVKDIHSQPERIYGANEAHRVEKLNFGRINEINITTDKHGINDKLWISSESGLWHLQQRFFKTVDNLPMNNPISISINEDGKAWTPMNYLFEISPKKNGFTAKPILDNLQVNFVANDIKDALWVTTSTPKVELLKYVNNRLVKRYDFTYRGESIFYLYPDSKGNLWFNQAPIDEPIIGVAQIDNNGNVKFYDDTKGFKSRVLALKESSRGEIYAVGIGEKSYLYRFDPKEDRFINLSPKLPFIPFLNFEAHDLTIDERGVVWLATTDGLLRYDGEKMVLIKNDILGQEEIRGVTHYSNNNVWVATGTRGLVFLQGNTSTILGESEGLPAEISTYRCITTDKDGRLWAGTAEGLVYSNIPASTLPNSNRPKIQKILIDGNTLSREKHYNFKSKDGQALELHFTNLSYPAKNVQYQFRLLPKEDKDILLEEQFWENSSSNILNLEDVSLGDYSLEVRARQPGGYQWSDSLEMELGIYTPWYAKRWILYSFIALIFAAIGYYFRVYAMRRFKRLQKVLKYSNEKLATKEELLNQKIKELEDKGNRLVSATSNIQTLNLFIKEIHKDSSWDEIIAAMGKAVTQTSDVNAFEIAFKDGEEIVHKGYSDQERSGYTFRAKPFSTKTSLTCWAMENNKEVLINDFKEEHNMYIEEKDAYRFNSLLFIPFLLETKQPAVLCAYSTQKNHFDENDLTMYRILAQFIFFSVQQELYKK